MKKIILTCLVVFLYSCDLIFVENISEDNIIAIAPISNSVLEEGTINFSWRELEDVDEYSFQIAVPNFEVATEILIDTITAETSFIQDLSVGSYAWRVKGINEEYETEYTNNEFSIENDISLEVITSILPVDNAILTPGEIVFSWEEVEGAIKYQLQIASPSFTETNEVLIETLITETRYSKELEAGDYEWRIKAVNELSETIYGTHILKIE